MYCIEFKMKPVPGHIVDDRVTDFSWALGRVKRIYAAWRVQLVVGSLVLEELAMLASLVLSESIGDPALRVFDKLSSLGL